MNYNDNYEDTTHGIDCPCTVDNLMVHDPVHMEDMIYEMQTGIEDLNLKIANINKSLNLLNKSIPTKYSNLRNDMQYMSYTEIDVMINNRATITENSIPTLISQLENDIDLISLEDLQILIDQINSLPQELSAYINDTNFIDWGNTVKLINDAKANFELLIEEISVPEKVSDLPNDAEYTSKEYVDGLYEELNDKTDNIISEANSSVSNLITLLENISKSIPTQMSQLNNDVGYITLDDVGELNNLKTTDKSSIVNAINELFLLANNGKKLIADAIGNELITVDSTFSAMSEAILKIKEENDRLLELLALSGINVDDIK